MMIIRRLLAKTIKPTEEKTIENVLKKALKSHLLDEYNGLCACVLCSLHHYGYLESEPFWDTSRFITKYVPEFTQKNAVLYFNADPKTIYWWPIRKWWPRYRFMKWLIKKYKE